MNTISELTRRLGPAMDPKDIRMALQGGLKTNDKPAVRAVLEIIAGKHQAAERAMMETTDPADMPELAGYQRGLTELARAILKEVDQ